MAESRADSSASQPAASRDIRVGHLDRDHAEDWRIAVSAVNSAFGRNVIFGQGPETKGFVSVHITGLDNPKEKGYLQRIALRVDLARYMPRNGKDLGEFLSDAARTAVDELWGKEVKPK